MPHWMSPALLAQTAGAFMLTLVFYYIHRSRQERCTGLWACSFATYAVWLVLGQMVLSRSLPSAFLVLFSQLALLISGFFMLWGTVEFVGKGRSRRGMWLYLAICALDMVWIIVAVACDVSFQYLILPTSGLLALIYATTGIVLLRSSLAKGVGKLITGYAFILWAICTALYPFTHGIPGQESFLAAERLDAALALVSVTVALGILLAYFEEAQVGLGHSEARFRSLFEKAAIGMAFIDMDGHPFEMNLTFKRMLGYTDDELARMTIHDMTYPDDVESDAGLYKLLIDGERDYYQIKKRYVRRDSKLIWGRLTVSLVRDSDNRPLFSIAMIENLTRRRRAEAARRATEDRFRLLVQKSGSAILCLTTDNEILELSKEAARVFGWDHDTTLGKDFFEVARGNLAGHVISQEIQAVLSGSDGRNFECLVEDAEGGGERTFMWNIARLVNSRGKHSGVIVIGQDISARKDIEQALRASETKYRELVEDANSIIMRRDVRGAITFFNEYAQKFFGYAEAEILGKNVVGVILPKVDSQGNDMREMTAEIARDPELYASNENENIKRNGERVWIAWTNKAIRDTHGRVTGLLCIGNDITRIKEAETALLHETERFRFLYNNTPVMLLLLDADSRIVEVNDYWIDLTGHHRDSVIGRPVADFLSERSREYMEKVVLPEFAKSGVCLDIPLTGVKANGETFEVLLSATAEDAEAEGNRRSLAAMVDVTRRKAAEVALRDREERYRLLFNSGMDAVFVHHLEPDGTPNEFIEVNDVAYERLGYTREELLSKTPLDIISGVSPRAMVEIGERLIKTGRTVVEVFHETSDGNKVPVELSMHLFELSGRPSALVVARDITQRKRLEDQLLRSQKMEAIGRLAGGVAHDFNNVLTAIMGYSELMLSEVEEDTPMREYVTEVRKAGSRAVALVRQLLAFSRRQVLLPRVLNLNQVVEDIEPMLGRLITENVELATDLAESVGNVKADPAQLEQIIMNLVVNARDAMPGGGRLNITTRNASADDIHGLEDVDLYTGRYVELMVSDTGCGMDEETKALLFEPFFTTKDQDKGTGLGLATVYGVVKQSGGYITVQSELNAGSVFRIFLPIVDAHVEEDASEIVTLEPRERDETILVVEDEAVVRALVCNILRLHGYNVLEGPLGPDALRIAAEYEERIDLLLTDVVMPQMSGVEVAERLADLHPETRVLFMSGYTDQTLGSQYGLGADLGFIQKPFSTTALVQKIQQILDGPAKDEAEGAD
jgi:two-component system, cell cycle sensor histidine kinase and response regulator CckA